MSGYKIFDKDLKCRGFQYAVGETAEHDGPLEICNSGLHYCTSALDCLKYYDLDGNRYAEVQAVGDVVYRDDKFATNRLKVVRELSRAEFVSLFHGRITYPKEFYSTQGTPTKDTIYQMNDHLIPYYKITVAELRHITKTDSNWNTLMGVNRTVRYKHGKLQTVTKQYSDGCIEETDMHDDGITPRTYKKWNRDGECLADITY